VTVGATSMRVPGDKSLSHRALIFGALAEGESRYRGVLEAQDVRSTSHALTALSADIQWVNGQVRVIGRGRRGLRAAQSDVDCRNSGTTARLLAGVVAGHPFTARFIGDESLSRRPMKRIKQPLEAMGAIVDLERGDGLPMVVRGGDLQSVVWRTNTASAQTKSAILLAALVAGVRAEVHEPVSSRDHTERLLSAMGASVQVDGRTVVLGPDSRLAPMDLDVPGDPSSAAFFLAVAMLAGNGGIEVRDVALNDGRIGFARVARRMGGRVGWDVEREVGGEPVGTMRARSSSLRGVVVEAAEVPSLIDELVLLACIATQGEGETLVRGAQELRVKESDRIAAVVHNLRAVGAEAEETADGFVVRGRAGPLRGSVRTLGDHRIAMAFGVLAALPGNDIHIDDTACVAVSYPTFWKDLEMVRP
jgi:3-phosphoshikimate 1-carboxyvinyltransferase